MTGLAFASLPDGPDDPIDGNDRDELRMEILRLRDGLAAAGAEVEVLEDLVAQLNRHVANLDTEIQRLDTEVQRLGAELNRNPVLRVGRLVMRRLHRRSPTPT